MEIPKRVALLVLFIVAATAGAAAQDGSIVLNGTKVSAGRIIDAIQAQTDYKVAYNRSVLDTAKMVGLPATQVSIKEALDGIAGDGSVKYMFDGRYIAFVPAKKQVKVESTPAAATPQRTGDVYRKSNINDLNGTPVVRPSRPEQPAAEPTPVPVQYSAYTPVARYEDLQTTLPRRAVKTNLLYGFATLTPNVAVEFAAGPKNTVEVAASYNPWRRDKSDMTDTEQMEHWMIRPEFRWWTCERFNGHYFGAHVFYARYMVSQKDVPLLFEKEYRYDGCALGAGATYGYHVPLGRRWGLDLNIGVGGAWMKYDKYTCAACDRDAQQRTKFYFGPTRAGITITFLLK